MEVKVVQNFDETTLATALETLTRIKIMVAELERLLENLKSNDPKEQKFYSIAEVSRLTGINHISLWRLIKKGEIQAIRVGNKYLIPADILKVPSFLNKE